MCRLPSQRRNHVHIDIKDRRPEGERQRPEADLLFDLSSSRREDVLVVRIDMPARLQPAPELAVENQEERIAGGREHEAAGCEVPWRPMIACEGIPIDTEEVSHPTEVTLLHRIAWDMGREEPPQVITTSQCTTLPSRYQCPPGRVSDDFCHQARHSRK